MFEFFDHSVVGFGFGPDRFGRKSEQEIADEYSSKRGAQEAAATNTEPLLVFVLMDSELDESKPTLFPSAFEHMRGVVAFSAIKQDNDITLKSGKFSRFQLPLVPAFATTYHKAQGVTAHHGLVMKPPAIRGGGGNIQFGLVYVGAVFCSFLNHCFMI